MFFWKQDIFKIIIFSLSQFNSITEKNYKKQAQMFYQNHSLMLYTVEIFYNSISRNINGLWFEKILNCLNGLTRLGLTLWCNQLELEKYLNYLSGLGYNILELDLEITQTTLLDLDWFVLDIELGL